MTPTATAREAASGRARWPAALWALLALAAALRLQGVLAFPYDQDELYTRIESRQLFHTALRPGIRARPLYYLLQHAIRWVLPDGTLTYRLLPLLLGVAGVWVVWRIARDDLGLPAAVAAAGMAAISPWHLYASEISRYWSLVFLLTALVFWRLPAAYDSDRPRDYLAVLLVLVLGTATHPTFLFPMPGVVLALSLVSREGGLGWRWPSRRAWGWLWGPYALLLLAAASALVLTGHGSAVRNWSGRGLRASLQLVPAMVQWMTPIVALAGGLGCLLLLRVAASGSRRRLGAVVLLGVLSSSVLLLVASTVTDVYADYGASMLPLVFVATGTLVQEGAELVSAGHRFGFAVLATLLIAGGVLPSTISHLSDGTRFDYRPAFRRIQAVDGKLPVYTEPLVEQRHYAPRLDGRQLVADPAWMEGELRSEGTLWVVASRRREGILGDSRNRFATWLTDRCRLEGAWGRPRFDYRLYRVELYLCGAASATVD